MDYRDALSIDDQFLFPHVPHTLSHREPAPSSLPAVLLVPLWTVLSACIGVLPLALVTRFVLWSFWICLDRYRVLIRIEIKVALFESTYLEHRGKSLSG